MIVTDDWKPYLRHVRFRRSTMSRLILGLSICVFVTASFVDTYSFKYRDYEANNELEQDRTLDGLKLVQDYIENDQENRRSTENELENWAGRWMPDRPGDPTPPPKVLPKNKPEYYVSITEHPHKYMGHVFPDCDDAKTNLTVDWDHSSSAYTCYGHTIMPRKEELNIYCEFIPPAYIAAHKCMNQTIEYDDDVPVYGPHRPLWPVYGEYEYLPKQRWLHSLEHGAIVMLYHPCANRLEVKRLKTLVKRCLWRHVITPYSNLDEDYPLALLSWGCRLPMSYVNPTVVKHFIRQKALHGPEQISNDGQFRDGLLKPSDIVTDLSDSILCPNMF